MKRFLIRFVIRAYISLVSIVLFFMICELAISIILPAVKPPARTFFNPFDSEENTDVGVRSAFVTQFFLEDPELFWKLNPEKGGGEVTAEGFRSLRRYGAKKQSTYRIVALGDSCTYGVGSDAMGSSYPALLESILNATPGFKRVEVINAGVPGYSSLQGMRYLRRILPAYKPDLVIVQFLHDDHVSWINTPDSRVVIHGNLQRNVSSTLRRWRLYELLRRGIFYARESLSSCGTSRRRTPYRVPPDEYKENLIKMTEEARREGSDVMLLVPAALPPYRFRKDFTDYQEATIAAAQKTGAPLLDLARIFDDIPHSRTFFWKPEQQDLAHLNSRGYAIEAEVVSARVLDIMKGSSR